MQDRYAGDVGDFLKYALLRWLCGSDDAALRLGVLWYLTPDEGHNSDGRHVTYLDPGNTIGESLRALDPDLHDRMRTVVMVGRSIAEVQRSGALPPSTVFADERLTFDDISGRAERLAHRRAWLDRALERLAGTDVIFADPDNGIRPTNHSQGRHIDRSIKHAYVDELAEFCERGQGLVVYHHADRSAVVETQIQRRLRDLADAGCDPIAAVRAARGTTRLFLVTGHGSVGDRLRERLESLTESHWRDELTVTWWDPDAAVSAKPDRRQTRQRAVDDGALSEECLRLTGEVQARSAVIETVANGRLNEILEVSPAGVLVHTLKSKRTGEPQLVPGWMVNVAWEHLRRIGTLEQDYLVATDGLNVKRSAFVIALLAHFPGVEVVSERPTVLSFAVN